MCIRDRCKYHVSGQLKVAPEHISDNVLKYMGKPENSVFNKFSDKFYQINEKIGKKQYLVPYLMSSHPGSTIRDAVRLAEYLHEHNINPQQVQDFYPTPGTISTCMFYTGIDPFTMKKVYVPKTPHEKSVQRASVSYTHLDVYKRQMYITKFNFSVLLFSALMIGNIFTQSEKYNVDLTKTLMFNNKKKKSVRHIVVENECNYCDIVDKFIPKDYNMVYIVSDDGKVKDIITETQVIDKLTTEQVL